MDSMDQEFDIPELSSLAENQESDDQRYENLLKELERQRKEIKRMLRFFNEQTQRICDRLDQLKKGKIEDKLIRREAHGR